MTSNNHVGKWINNERFATNKQVNCVWGIRQNIKTARKDALIRKCEDFLPRPSPDSVCKLLVSTDQFDQRVLPLKQELLQPLMNEDHVSSNSQAPIFTTSHRSPQPLSIPTSTNWADYCKMLQRENTHAVGLRHWDASAAHADLRPAQHWLASFFFGLTSVWRTKLLKPEPLCRYWLRGYERGPIQ